MGRGAGRNSDSVTRDFEGVRVNKKTEPFIPFEERLEIVCTCRYVDEAVDYSVTISRLF